VLVALGVRRDGQKVLLALRNMGGESEAAWRVLLDDLVARGLAVPELIIVDGASGLEKAIAALWNDVPLQRCTVHKHRNLLAHAPKKLYDEISADYADMIYARTVTEVDAKRSAFLRKWRLRCRPVAASLEEAGDQLFTFLRFPSDQWKSIRTTDEIDKPSHAGLVFLSGTGDRVAKSGARGCKLRRAAAIVAPPLRRPCAVPVVGGFAIGLQNVRRRAQPAVPPRSRARAVL
jgi:hypothetical protein